MGDYHNPYIKHLDYTEEELSPLGSQILVRVLERPGKTTSGIIITEYNASDRGVVVKVGESVREDIFPGDVVLYRWRSGDDFQSSDNEHLMFLEEDAIFAKLGTENDWLSW